MGHEGHKRVLLTGKGYSSLAELRLRRPLVIAGHWHSEPWRVFALHRGALVKSPEGLPFFNQPRRGSWGTFLCWLRRLTDLHDG
jgi:hypothetical protein